MACRILSSSSTKTMRGTHAAILSMMGAASMAPIGSRMKNVVPLLHSFSNAQGTAMLVHDDASRDCQALAPFPCRPPWS